MTGDIVPFGRTPEDRARNAERARHPAGKRRHLEPVDPDALPTPRWASEYPSSVEERRANILAAKPACKVCERPFRRGTHVPADRVCFDCRKDMTLNGPEAPPADPSLF